MRQLFKWAGMTSAFVAMLALSSCSSKDNSPTATKSDPYNGIEAKKLEEKQIDSLMIELTDMTILMAESESFNEFTSLAFDSLASSFAAAAKADPSNMEVRVGFITAKTLSLNSNPKMVEIADSLDAYLNGQSDSRSISGKLAGQRTEKHLLRNAAQKGGINGLATALIARTPEIILARSSKPSVPSFLTISYIQDMIEEDFFPVLDEIRVVFDEIEALGDDKSITFSVEDETVEVDMADIYLLDATFHAFRAELALFTAYDWDIYTSSTDQSYSWIDKMRELDDTFQEMDTLRYTLSTDKDTLIQERKEAINQPLINFQYDLFKYNFERETFLTSVRETHARAYEDLKAVPAKISKALDLLNSEIDAQDDDIVKKNNLQDLNGEMADSYSELVKNGYSPQFAENFRSPKSLALFIEKILVEPYTFSENINGVQYDLTVDLSKFFTNPIKDIRKVLPKYEILSKEEATKDLYTSSYTNTNYGKYYKGDSYYNLIDPYIYNEKLFIAISEYSTIVDTTEETEWIKVYNEEYDDWEYVEGGMITVYDTIYQLPQDYSYERSEYIRSDFEGPFSMMSLVDDNGKELSDDESFPYFEDYTFNGIFPEMTRQKWIDLIEKLD